MSMLREMMNRLRSQEEGATAVEYGIMVALIAAVIVAVVLVLGSQVKEGFCDTSSGLSAGSIAGTGATGC